MSTSRRRTLLSALPLLLTLTVCGQTVTTATSPGPPVPAVPAGDIRLEVVGQLSGPSRAVAVRGEHAYVGMGRRLVVVDVADPALPREVGDLDVPEGVQGLAVDGDIGYLLLPDGTLRVLDLSTPAAPWPIHLPLAALGLRRAGLAPPPTKVPPPTATATDLPTVTPTEPPATPTATAVPCPGLAERVTVTTSNLGAANRANDEYFPLPVAPRPAGGALVAWREQAALRIRVGAFDERDRLVGTPLTFAGEEVHALVAHEDGGALAVVENDPDIYSAKYCRGPSTPDKSYCAKLDLWRFDGAGKTQWRTTVTDKKNVDTDGAHFIWWYQHTARLVWTGTEYGLYFRSASSSPRPGVPGEIDIHAGDAFRFLDGAGKLLDSAWGWGCSHSWAVRLAFNGHFGAACHGDAYPNSFHVNILDRQKRLGEANLHEGLDPTKRALGGMVPTPGGFWLLHMAQPTQTMYLHLAFIDNAGRVTRDQPLPEATDLETAYPFRAYLAEYGADQMLAGWFSAGTLQLAVLDRATGALVTGPVAVTAKIDKWNEFVPFPNGDVAWAWSAGGTDRLDLVRVRACGG